MSLETPVELTETTATESVVEITQEAQRPSTEGGDDPVVSGTPSENTPASQPPTLPPSENTLRKKLGSLLSLFSKIWRRSSKNTDVPLVPFQEGEFAASCNTLDTFLKNGGAPSPVTGESLDFERKIFSTDTSLLNLDLRHARFRGADIHKQSFGNANVAEANFSDADLTDADLSLVVGLQPHQLSGADLSRCKLPADVAAFPALANVTTLSQNAGKMFLTTLLACIFVLLTAFTTGDIQLLTNSGTAELPVLKISVSTQLFFGIAPLVLLILSLTTHLYLQRLWETMAQLPAVFPDGATVDNKTYPWLVNDLIRTGFPLLQRKKHQTPLAWMQLKAFATIAYGTVPLTLLAVFLRCLPRHDPVLSGWQTVLLALAVGWASLVSYLNAITLWRKPQEKQDFLHQKWRAVWRPTGNLAVSLVIGGLVTLYAIWGTPLILSAAQKDQAERWSNSKIMTFEIARIDAAMLETNAADERKALAASKAEIQALTGAFQSFTRFAPWHLSGFRRVAFSGYAEQPWAIPLPALSPGKIVEDASQISDKWKPTEANYPAPPLPRIATLNEEQLINEISNGTLKTDDLTITDAKRNEHEAAVQKWQECLKPMVKGMSFQGMNLRFLHARGAFLVNADLRRADMTGADFGGADLRNAQFYTGIETPIALSFAVLNQSRLDGANLSEAKLNGAGLSGATLNAANLSGATLNGADLTFARLNAANLRGATLNGADLSVASLNGADLIGARLNGTYLSKATLNGADLTNANLNRANLSGAKLNRARLTTANLNDANLVEATFNGANLSGAKLNRAYLSEATLNGADLTFARLNAANLSGANLNRAHLTAANLNDANLSEAMLNGAYYSLDAIPQWPKGKIPSGWRTKPIDAKDKRANGETNYVELIPVEIPTKH